MLGCSEYISYNCKHIVVCRVVTSISATAVDILCSSGRSCSEFISYNCKPILMGGVLASISATAVDI